MRMQNEQLNAEKEQLKDEVEARLNKIRSLNAEIESKVEHFLSILNFYKSSKRFGACVVYTKNHELKINFLRDY